MTTTANLQIDHIAQSQAQKEVTHNEGMDILDAAVAGVKSIAMSDADYTLDTTTGPPYEWQYGVLEFTGTLTAARNIIVPANRKLYVIVNATSGGYALTVKTSAGAGVAIAAGKTAIVRCDGTDVKRVTPDT